MSEIEKLNEYFEELRNKTLFLYEIANEARKKGYDPENKVEIPLAKDIAERVEGLISVKVPEIVGKGIPKRIKELEKEFGQLDWRVAMTIAKEVAEGKFFKFEDKIKALETGVRVGLAYITLGTVSAPIEGFVELKEKKRKDGKPYLAAYFAGPIRGAGGTAAAVSVLLADYLRFVFNYPKYDPTEEEIKRYQIEIQDYHERVTRLQYYPSPKEIEFLIKNIGIEITGIPTEKKQVSNYKDLPRVETNFIRGGMCLVLAEGLAQKAKKLWKKLGKWGESFGFTEWNWLKEFLELQAEIKAKGDTKKEEKKEEKKSKIKPDFTYIKELAAGRPVFGYPLRFGGFRLRYGRCNLSGFAAQGIHPATMEISYKFLATGTQMKTERPGKGTIAMPIDSIEGPIVKLRDGTVRRVEDIKEAELLVKTRQISKILFLGDLLIAYGDFKANGHKLVPAGYNEEWWVQDVLETFDEELKSELVSYLEKKCKENKEINAWKYCRLKEVIEFLESNYNFELKDSIDKELFNFLSKERFFDILAYYQVNLNDKEKRLNRKEAFLIAYFTKTPLHPYYTYFWDQINEKDLNLIEELKEDKLFIENYDKLKKFFKKELNKDEIEELIELIDKEIEITYRKEIKELLEKICLPHKLKGTKIVFYLLEGLPLFFIFHKKTNKLKELNEFFLKIEEKSGTFIGTRMGRPEKAKMRELKGSPDVLFVVGDEGGKMRNLIEAHKEYGFVEAEVATFLCKKCKKIQLYKKCVYCDSLTERVYFCKNCGYVKGKTEENKIFCEKCNSELKPYSEQRIPTEPYLRTAIKKMGLGDYPDLIKGVRGLSSRDKIVERLEKGLACKLAGVKKNKDGTVRFDATQAPITHFRPKDLLYTTIEDLKKLGYTHDIFGNPLEREDQILELKPQDVILPACDKCAYPGADKIGVRMAKYVDLLLKNLYETDEVYRINNPKELIGQLVIGLAPHTSAGIIGRIIGFSNTQPILAHPLWHAAQRRNCDGDETCFMLALDTFLNFSRAYLPDHNGGTMDAPVVVTVKLIPSEVDDEVHEMDIVPIYPKELYLKAKDYSELDSVKVEVIADRLGKPNEYFGMRATHYSTTLNEANNISAYKVINDMTEKVKWQMDLAEKLVSVDEGDAASLIIEKHLYPDIKGNFRKFFTQDYRCVQCNEKFRRIPLIGKCPKCEGNIVFTISEGSVKKYLDVALELTRKYKVKDYVKENLLSLKKAIDTVFKGKNETASLTNWFKK